MEVEAKVHFTLKCPFFDGLRNSVLQLTNVHYPTFTELVFLVDINPTDSILVGY